MPPKAKYSKEQIIDGAFNIVREKGASSLSARNLAKYLGISTGPIFVAFNSIEEIQESVLAKAKDLYNGYISEGLEETPSFKGAGMKFIQFAKDEPELFKIIFLSENKSKDEFTHFLPQNDDNYPIIQDAIEKSYGMSPEEARNLYNHMSVYAYGFASLYMQKIYTYTMEDISRMMTEVFSAIIKAGKKDKS